MCVTVEENVHKKRRLQRVHPERRDVDEQESVETSILLLSFFTKNIK